MDLKLTDYDVDLTDGELSFVRLIDAVRQDIEMGLRTWLAETAYDRNAGLPYLQVIFQRGTTVTSIRFIILQFLLARDGVEEVIELDTSVDRNNRELTVTGRLRALNEEFPLQVVVDNP